MMKMYHVIRRPVVTEKTSALKSVENQAVFEVDRQATKHQIREAVETLFGVKVLSVNTMLMPSRTRRFGRTVGVRHGWKKAIVTLQEGQEIELFPAMDVEE
jgi:large subunit ribosomal protein L23